MTAAGPCSREARSVDIFQKCRDSAGRTVEMRAEGVYPYYRTLSSAQEPVVLHQGRGLVMLGSNNYLGLTNHPAVKEASDRRRSKRYGTGCAGLAPTQRHPRHPRPTRAPPGRVHEARGRAHVLHRLPGEPRACSPACLGATGRGDPRQHWTTPASSTAAGSASVKTLQVSATTTWLDLEKKLRIAPEDQSGKLVVVDGVFSMEGDLSAPLPRDHRAGKQRYGARVMVDDAHGLGVFGESWPRNPRALRRRATTSIW